MPHAPCTPFKYTRDAGAQCATGSPLSIATKAFTCIFQLSGHSGYGLKRDLSDISSGNQHFPMRLIAIFPNPIQSSFTVSMGAPTAGVLEIAFYDALGRRVNRMADEIVAAGWHKLELTRPGTLAPGVYFLRVSAGGQTATRAVVIP